MPKYRLRILLAFLAASWMVPDDGEAIPAFSRRYALPCSFCHDGYPQLSVLGEQFKERGFRLDDDVTEMSDWLRTVPVSVRAGLRQTFEEEGDAETNGLFRFISAGSLGSRASYWIDYDYTAGKEDTSPIDTLGATRDGVDNAFLRVEILPDELYVRGGRVELDLPFTQTRSPQLFRYDIYFASTGFETDAIGVHQDGVEVGGFLDDVTHWSFAVVDGHESEGQSAISDNVGGFDANVFGRVMRRFGEDRAGAYVYWGRNGLATHRGGQLLEWENRPFRLGADASVYLGQAHIFGTFMYGRDNNPFADPANPDGTGQALSFTGGFAQVDFAFRDEIVVSGRLSGVRSPPPGTAEPSKSFVEFLPGLRIWLHERVRLAFELGFRNQNRPTRGAFHIELVL